MTSTNKVRAAAKLDLGALLATATVAETTVTAYIDRAAVHAYETNRDDTDARDRAAASKITLRARRATPGEKAEAIARFVDDRENTIGFPSETVYNQRLEHIVGAALLSISDHSDATIDGPIPQPEMAQLRAAIGEHAWARLREFTTGESNDSALDADFSPAPSGATPN